MSKPEISGGFIILSRKIIESEIWNKPPLYIKVWIYLLTSAQHTSYKGLNRGELRTSIPEIIEACKWYVGARIERPTKDQIFRILDWLRKPDEHPCEHGTNTTMITTTKATHAIIVKVDNYAFYQDIANYETNAEHNGEKDAKEVRTVQQRDNINKNVKNDKNVKKERSKDQNPLLSPQGEKVQYSDYVFLTEDEYRKLTELLGEVERERLFLEYASWISGQTARVQKSRSAYLTILNWSRREQKQARGRPARPAQTSDRTLSGKPKLEMFQPTKEPPLTPEEEERFKKTLEQLRGL